MTPAPFWDDSTDLLNEIEKNCDEGDYKYNEFEANTGVVPRVSRRTPRPLTLEVWVVVVMIVAMVVMMVMIIVIVW